MLANAAENLTALPAPPDPAWPVNRHVVDAGGGRSVFFFGVQDIEPGVAHVAEAWILVPSDFRGTDVALVMIGFSTEHYEGVDLDRRDVWQRVSVTVRVPADQTQAAPCLIVTAPPGSAILSTSWVFRRLVPFSGRRAASAPRRYRAVSLARAAADPELAAIIPGWTPPRRVLPDADVAIPPVSFGQLRRPDAVSAEWPPGCWDLAGYKAHDMDMFTLPDAVIHGEQGIVTVGDVLIDETLHFANPAFAGFERTGPDTFDGPDLDPDVELDAASHLLCGYVGNRNYPHWWVDIVPALLVPPFHDAFDGTSLVFPKRRARWQTEALALLPEATGRSVFVGEHSRVLCRTLRYVPRIMNSDMNPHPHRAAVLGAVKERAGWRGEGGRRIYVSRRDAGARRLLNEEAAIALLERHGFEALTLTGKPVREQVAIFAAASHVVGAHGAGLGNVIFCPPGAVLCEFQMMSNVQWSIRRLAAVTGMRYGCIMGTASDDSQDVNLRDWTVELDDLEAVLRSPDFV